MGTGCGVIALYSLSMAAHSTLRGLLGFASLGVFRGQSGVRSDESIVKETCHHNKEAEECQLKEQTDNNNLLACME